MMTQAIDLDHPVLGFTHQWVCELAKHFEHIHVISRLEGGSKLPNNVTVHAYATPNQRDVPFQRHFFFNRKLASLILGNHVDTIFIHMIPKWVMMAYRFSRLKRIPISLWYTHVAPDSVLLRAHRVVNWGLTAVNESYHYFDQKVVALGHGINTEVFSPATSKEKSDKFRILMVGRLSPIKRVDLLIEAIGELKGKIPLTCKIIGAPANQEDNDYLKKLKSMIQIKHLKNEVQLIGAVPFRKIPELYQASDLMINLTEANSFDKTVLEAMACGLPVISSNPSFFPTLKKFNPNFMLKSLDENQLAVQIFNIASLPETELAQLNKKLRQEIISHHNLQKLMAKIATILRNETIH